MRTRSERDSMGEVLVPQDALYGAQTQRALDNFGLQQRPMPGAFIRALAAIKAAAARANSDCAVLDPALATAIASAARSIADGEHAQHFPVSVFQTGSGTSSNMNVNEVIARLASAASGLQVHPNDHVNCSQSSNDVVPSAIQVLAMGGLSRRLEPALGQLIETVRERADELYTVTKTGRTHLMDAMPLTFGQELGAWAEQLQECGERFAGLKPRLGRLPLGGSAVGTGVNVPAGFRERCIAGLSSQLALHFEPADNPFSRMAGQDVSLELSSTLRALAVVLGKVANDLRWMGSGPLSGLAEIQLQALQPGSSIMPGKVNPVLPEAVLMVAADVMGNDASIALSAHSGNFQLNVMLPLIAEKLAASIDALVWACEALRSCIAGFTVNTPRVEANLAANPILVTALNARLGYDRAATIAKRAYAEQRPVLDVALEECDLSREELEVLLDPQRLTGVEDWRED
ncbi:class II fumarate hydratase [Mangrovimicrobium sediminis]|uniref:fumarate hydratase n=1 Tax=Mangrovimicrobium sediminis TaxID=2562682 RepID=A0A4Z0MA33_9GAMM|nr:class II fumarate hydratase [Haliea sp. SAOS-164]TGD76155.1 class II fumarate hydratase [Haliea sp. SAOS-164]